MDTIGDALIRIKNGYMVGKSEVSVRYSKLIVEICKLLQAEGYIEKCSVDEKNREIIVTLKYNARVPSLTDVKRVSRPSLRVYKGAKALPSVLNGLGIAIVSTPKGLMTNKQARKQNLGGEVLALVW
ncbi:30S ribosomal protein S8 [Candidatus Daviesbacteria bacterium]|nr:30S ribosomal protein S8 [Candidatus Daviesbacteria bacterium]